MDRRDMVAGIPDGGRQSDDRPELTGPTNAIVRGCAPGPRITPPELAADIETRASCSRAAALLRTSDVLLREETTPVAATIRSAPSCSGAEKPSITRALKEVTIG
jgi:actin-like ATPase involved in cell morphogenesis